MQTLETQGLGLMVLEMIDVTKFQYENGIPDVNNISLQSYCIQTDGWMDFIYLDPSQC